MREKLGDSVEIMKERIEDMNMGSGLRNTLVAVVVIYCLIAVVLGYYGRQNLKAFWFSKMPMCLLKNTVLSQLLVLPPRLP